jgi:diguanylate cyclase (GGDEF)-like protein
MIRQLVHRSAIDPLTGIYNRRSLEDQIRRLVAQAKRHRRPLSVIFIDVDYFKSINDRFGHAAGDQVLKQTAQRLRSEIREHDIVGRYGGEEFCLLLPDTGLEAACATAERLRSAVRQIRRPGDCRRQLTISSGVAAYLPEETWEQCWNRADQALYAAKRNGRDQVWYHNGSRVCRYTSCPVAPGVASGSPSAASLCGSPAPSATQVPAPASGGLHPCPPKSDAAGQEHDPQQAADSWQDVCRALRRRLEEVLIEENYLAPAGETERFLPGAEDGKALVP